VPFTSNIDAAVQSLLACLFENEKTITSLDGTAHRSPQVDVIVWFKLRHEHETIGDMGDGDNEQ
jgi:hypothetical protein